MSRTRRATVSASPGFSIHTPISRPSAVFGRTSIDRSPSRSLPLVEMRQLGGFLIHQRQSPISRRAQRRFALDHRQHAGLSRLTLPAGAMPHEKDAPCGGHVGFAQNPRLHAGAVCRCGRSMPQFRDGPPLPHRYPTPAPREPLTSGEARRVQQVAERVYDKLHVCRTRGRQINLEAVVLIDGSIVFSDGG
jgi:hypothetical protein